MPARSRFPDSTRATLNPALARTYTAIPPPGPLPTTQTSKICLSICSHQDNATNASVSLWSLLAWKIDLLKQEQPRLSGCNQTDVTVAVNIHGDNLNSAPGLGSVVDDVLNELTVLWRPAIPVQTERLISARVALIREITLSSDDVQPAISVQVDECERMRLRPTIIDQVFLPLAGAQILHPEKPVA